jgi:peptide/nickel transport system ATP-binding protein
MAIIGGKARRAPSRPTRSSTSRPRGRDRGHRRRIRLRQVHLRQGADGPRDRHRRHHLSSTARTSPIDTTPGQKRDTGRRHLQMVFQNPFDTLNPSHTVGGQIARVIREVRRRAGPGEGRRPGCWSCSTSSSCRATSPAPHAAPALRRPEAAHRHRPRLRRQPPVVVADEPVSALDVSVQAAVTELLMDIQREHRTTLLFISHDLSLVRYLADRVVVMYLGHHRRAGHHRRGLRAALPPLHRGAALGVPIADTSVVKKQIVLQGDIPSAVNPPPGCPFQTRCQAPCREVPPMRTLKDTR